MKINLMLALICFPAAAYSAEKINLNCSVPTTEIAVSTIGDQVISKFTHPAGIRFTPMHRGAIPSMGIAQLQAQEKILAALGNEQTFVWGSSSCKSRENNIFECDQGKSFELNGWKIRPILFRTMRNQLALVSGDYEIFTVEVIFLVENAPPEAGLMFSLSNDFSFQQHCIL